MTEFISLQTLFRKPAALRIEVMPTLKFDGLTGEGMTWSKTGEVSKAPRAVVIKDGTYVTPGK